MTAYYVDTSAFVSALLADEPDHARLRELLFGAVLASSELTRVELASAATSAVRQGRIPDAARVMDYFDDLCAADGPVALIPFDAVRMLPAARRLVCENYPVRTLEAIQLAVAMRGTAELIGGRAIAFVTRDQRQADAAKAKGLDVG